MSRVNPMQTSHNGGELSPMMNGRPDHEMWPVSLKEMLGWLPRPQGPAEACPGFEHVDIAAGECRLIPFEPYTTQGYVIEGSALLFRFYTNDVLLESGGSPVTVVTPWSLAQVQEMWTHQSIDVMYCFHPDEQQRLLERTAADAFSLSTLDLENGPFLDRNDDETLTLSFNGVTGSVTVTASAALFAATDVGRLIEIEAHDLSDIPSWEPGITVTLGDFMQWDGRVYQVTGGGGTTLRTGTVQPVHTRGVEWDGIGAGQDLNENDAGGVELAYVHDAYGRLKITAYTSATSVTATVTRRLPLQSASSYQIDDYLPDWYIPDGAYVGTGTWSTPGGGSYTAGTWRWRLGAFSDTTGWPEGGLIWNQRLWLWANNRLYSSVVGSLHDFDRLNEYGEVSADQAITVQLEKPHFIRWGFAGRELFIGTETSEYVVRAQSAAQPLGPTNIAVEPQDDRGSAAARPVGLNARPIFLQRNRRKVLFEQEDSYGRYVPEDLTRYADHIGNSPFVEMCWQKEPLQLLWAVREDGVLACADYMPDEAVLGWCRRALADGFTAESICSISNPAGTRDDLWLSAEIGGARHVMKLAAIRNAGEVQDLPIMLDGALTYDNPGSPISTITLAHLKGETVEVVADGAWLGEFTADAVTGDVVLDEAAGQIVSGKAFDARMTYHSIEAGGDNGPAQGKMRRTHREKLRVQDTLGLAVQLPNGETQSIGNLFEGDDLDAAITPFTGDIVEDVVGHWERDGELTVLRELPFPATVLARMPTVEVSQR
jgi:hypothetical protein